MTKNGLVVDEDGWFVINARDARWSSVGPLGIYCNFEGKRRFKQFGININVLQPGEGIGMYHRERAQEGFLVVAGECILVVEQQERPLRTWDFVHMPGGTDHMIVGAGGGPSIVVAVGARGRGVGGGTVYVASEAAARHGVSVEKDTTSSAEAYKEIYANLPRSRFVPYREGLLPDEL